MAGLNYFFFLLEKINGLQNYKQHTFFFTLERMEMDNEWINKSEAIDFFSASTLYCMRITEAIFIGLNSNSIFFLISFI